MKKNVLILSSSPRRKGNSDLLCDRFLRKQYIQMAHKWLV